MGLRHICIIQSPQSRGRPPRKMKKLILRKIFGVKHNKTDLNCLIKIQNMGNHSQPTANFSE